MAFICLQLLFFPGGWSGATPSSSRIGVVEPVGPLGPVLLEEVQAVLITTRVIKRHALKYGEEISLFLTVTT